MSGQQTKCTSAIVFYAGGLVPHTASTSSLPGTHLSANRAGTWQFRIITLISLTPHIKAVGKNKQAGLPFLITEQTPNNTAPPSAMLLSDDIILGRYALRAYGVGTGDLSKPTTSVDSKGTKTSYSKKHRDRWSRAHVQCGLPETCDPMGKVVRMWEMTASNFKFPSETETTNLYYQTVYYYYYYYFVFENWVDRVYLWLSKCFLRDRVTLRHMAYASPAFKRGCK